MVKCLEGVKEDKLTSTSILTGETVATSDRDYYYIVILSAILYTNYAHVHV